MPTTPGELDLPPDVRPRFAALGAWGQSIDSSAQAYAREVQQAASAVLGAVEQWEEGWRLVCKEVLDGRIAEMHAQRDRFLAAYTDRLRLLGEARALVRFAAVVAQRQLPEAEQLGKEAETLQGKLKQLASRWQSAEDLEDLAAESIAPSSAKLEAVRGKYGYPQAWYDDDSKPF